MSKVPVTTTMDQENADFLKSVGVSVSFALDFGVKKIRQGEHLLGQDPNKEDVIAKLNNKLVDFGNENELLQKELDLYKIREAKQME